MRRFVVGLRISAITTEHVEAATAEEAAAIASDVSSDPNVLRDNVLSSVPLWYETEDGVIVVMNTSHNAPERKTEIRNALNGLRLWALTRTGVSHSGARTEPYVRIYLSRETAFRVMKEDYEALKRGDVVEFEPPRDGCDACYMVMEDKSGAWWDITVADFS